MDAADARGRTDEHSPLLRETASDEAMKGARAGRDGFNKPRPGLFVLGAVAVCGVFALASGKRPPASTRPPTPPNDPTAPSPSAARVPTAAGWCFFLTRGLTRGARTSSHRALPLPLAGPAWRYGASAHAKLGTWDDVFEASVDAAAAAAANAHWSHTPSDVSILGTTTLADDFASENGECSSLASAAREKSVFTYEPPKQCAMMLVCAGSPRAASTAHCVIAEHVLKNMMAVLKSKDASVAHDQPQYAGYWNYHLHSLCDDGEACELYDGSDRTVDEFESKIDTLSGLDDEKKKSLKEAMGEVRDSLSRLAEADAESVVAVKTHEFDARLMSACAKRLVLTSWRDKEQVFDSGLELGWFTYPKEESRVSFDKVYDMWQSWRRCWTRAVDADPFHTRWHDLSFDALNSEDSFRAEVRRLAEIIMHVMNIPTDALSVDWIVDEAVKQDFQEELNPTMTNGNLPTEKESAAETKEETAEETEEETSGDAPVADETAAATNDTTASTPEVNADFQGALIEEAIEDVVEETATEVAAEEEAIDDAVGEEVGEVEATNDAVAEQIEEITQNVETLDATSMAKQSASSESVVSSSRVEENENAGVDVEPGVVWTRRGAGDVAASVKGALRAGRRASRHSSRKNIFDSKSDMDIAEVPTVEATVLDVAEEADAEEPEEWVSGASGFDDAEDDADIAARAF